MTADIAVAPASDPVDAAHQKAFHQRADSHVDLHLVSWSLSFKYGNKEGRIWRLYRIRGLTCD